MARPLAVGLFLIQSHVGYAVMVGGVRSSPRGHRLAAPAPAATPPTDRRSRHSLVALTAGLALLAWAPVVIDEVAGSGNLTEIARYFMSSDEAPAGTGTALGQAARHLAIPDAPWLGDKDPNGDDGAILGGDVGALLVPVAAFGLALLAAARARQWAAVRFQALVGVLAVSGLVATSRITGPVFGYLVRWWWVIACLWWLSTLWSAGTALSHWHRLPRTARATLPWLVAPVLVAVVLSTTIHTAGAADAAATPDPSATEVLGHLLDPTVEALPGAAPCSWWPPARSGARPRRRPARARAQRHRGGGPSPRDAFRYGEERSTDRARSGGHAVGRQRRRRHRMDVASRGHPTGRLGSARAARPSRLPVRGQSRTAADRRRPARSRPGVGDGRRRSRAPGPGTSRGSTRTCSDRIEAIRRKGDPVGIFVGPPTDPADPRPRGWPAARRTVDTRTP